MLIRQLCLLLAAACMGLSAAAEGESMTDQGDTVQHELRTSRLFFVPREGGNSVCSAEVAEPNGGDAYYRADGKTYAVNICYGQHSMRAEREEVTVAEVSPAGECLSPVFKPGVPSHTGTSIGNILSDAGRCYILPGEACKVERHAVSGLPPTMRIERCASAVCEGRLLLLLRDTSTGGVYYAFYSPETSALVGEPEEVSSGRSEDVLPCTSLVWTGKDLVWEIGVHKWNRLSYRSYSLSKHRYTAQSTLCFSGEVAYAPVVVGQYLYLIGSRTGELIRINAVE